MVRKNISQKPEFWVEANQAQKHQFVYNLSTLYFGVVARDQYLVSPDSGSFSKSRGLLAVMFSS